MEKQVFEVIGKSLPMWIMVIFSSPACVTSNPVQTSVNIKISQLTHCDILAILNGNVALTLGEISTDRAISVFSKGQVKMKSKHFDVTVIFRCLNIVPCLIIFQDHRYISESKCQILLMSTDSSDDLKFLNNHRFNVTLNVLILTKNHSVARSTGSWSRKPFNFAVFVERRGELEWQKDYVSANDPLWKKTRLAFTIMPPYVTPTNEMGKFSGTDFDIWAEIAVKLDLDLVFSNQKSYDAMFKEVSI